MTTPASLEQFVGFGSDFLFASIGSALFWIMLSGIAFRALKLDFIKFEEHLKSLYSKLDQATFSVRESATFLIDRLMASIYGRTVGRQILAVTIACGAVFALSTFSLWNDWRIHSAEISKTVAQALEATDPSFYGMMQSPEGAAALDEAHRLIYLRNLSVYANRDEASIALRERTRKFGADYASYIRSNGLVRAEALDRYFGEAQSARGAGRLRWAAFVAGLLLTLAGVVIFDMIALVASLTLFDNLRSGNNVALPLITAFACFFLSQAGYAAMYMGHLGSVLGLLLSLAICAFWFGLTGFLLHQLVTKQVSLAFVVTLAIYSGLMLWGAQVFLDFDPLEFFVSPFRTIVEVVEGSTAQSMMVGATSLAPLFLMAGFFVTLALLKLVFVAAKSVFLGQVYGASVMSGATFFCGFVSTMATTTAFVLMLVSAFVG